MWYNSHHKVCVEIEGYSYLYQQPFSIGKSVYSSFSQESGKPSLNLMAYANGLDDSEGFCMISIHGLDITNLKLPYTLTGNQGSVSWMDVSHPNNTSICEKYQNSCFYLGYGQQEIQITLTNISSGVVSGVFSGRLDHIVNSSLEKHMHEPIEISEGYFTMRYE